MPDDAAVLLIATRQVARDVDERDDRDAECVAEADEARRLHRGVDVDRPGQEFRLVADDADHMTAEAAEADDDVLREERLHLEELAVVQDSCHDLPHVVGLVRRLGNDGLQLRVGPLVVIGRRHVRRPLVVARWQVRQQAAHAGGAFLLGARQEMRDA